MFKTLLPFPLMAAVQESQSVGSADVGKMPAAVTNPPGAVSGTSAEGDSAATTEARKRAAASNFLPIVRGRLPVLFVHAVRFDPVLEKIGNKDLATKMATSVGKIFDIRKGRNFAYINKDWKPTTDDLTQAQAWIDQVGKENAKGLTAAGDTKVMEQMVAQYKGAGLASPTDVAALAAAKAAARPAKAPAVAGTPAPATGSASPAATGGKTSAAKTVKSSADDLLS